MCVCVYNTNMCVQNGFTHANEAILPRDGEACCKAKSHTPYQETVSKVIVAIESVDKYSVHHDSNVQNTVLYLESWYITVIMILNSKK
jgi:hypothetical protein